MSIIKSSTNNQVVAAMDLYGVKVALEVQEAINQGKSVEYINRILKRERENL